ncbi:MAG: hypothetical protein F6K19_38650 [Cyanothece sp. SIO1E1]|nr:hypothetical protein [Cyanothece sp. SIO1E1]
MSNPLVHAFFIGRAFAEAIGEQLESSMTNTLSELGKFDAEQRERLRNFTEQVIERAITQEESAMQGRSDATTTSSGTPSADLQATIDDLRAEIARLRTALQQYRGPSA